MSIAGNNVITRLNYIQKEVGRKVKSSKKYHQWEFSLNGNYHKIELFHSLVSGRKKLVVDGDYILKDDSYFNDFRYEFELDGKILELKQKKMNEYELFICDKSFNEMKKEEQEGKYIDLVKKQIEKLKLNNEYNKIYKNNRNKIYEEHDFEQEEEEDEEYENNNYGFQNNYNYKKNIQYSNNNFSNNFRNDDDFYKSNGDDFDFSQTAFEKNKKILENFDFFGDDDGSNMNRNNYQNQNSQNFNQITNNNGNNDFLSFNNSIFQNKQNNNNYMNNNNFRINNNQNNKQNNYNNLQMNNFNFPQNNGFNGI